MAASIFGSRIPVMNHAFAPGPYSAYEPMRQRTACGKSTLTLHSDETMTSSQLVTCLECVAAGFKPAKRR